MHGPADIKHQAQIAARYLEHLTRSLRQQERRAREQGETTDAHNAATWAERAHELRHFIETHCATKPQGGNHDRQSICLSTQHQR